MMTTAAQYKSCVTNHMAMEYILYRQNKVVTTLCNKLVANNFVLETVTALYR